MEIRLQKWLSEQGVASRRQAEAMIVDGLVKVNGRPAELGMKVNPGADAVMVRGRLVQKSTPNRQYWILNKPDKFLVSRKDEKQARPTIYDLPSVRRLKTVMPTVGRLDYRTEGLLLLSNDGEFVFRMTHPKYKVPRTYHVLVNKRLDDAELETLQKGIRLYGKLTRPLKVAQRHTETLGASQGQWYEIIIAEGRYRIVRRIFEHFGRRVLRLVRVAYGELWLPPTLKPGETVAVEPAMIQKLKHSVGMR